MITIKTNKENEYGGAIIKVAKGTPFKTMILGAEMLIEQILEQFPDRGIDMILDDIRRIYTRDKKEEL